LTKLVSHLYFFIPFGAVGIIGKTLGLSASLVFDPATGIQAGLPQP
jgi:hypothetical protein